MSQNIRISEIPEEIRPLASDLIECQEFQRLKNISFLGAIERFGNLRCSSSAGSRYDHSLGVAGLVLQLRNYFNLSPGEFRIAFVHALLHDIGHGPFSHSSEEFFRRKFGIDHHAVLQNLVENKKSPISLVLRHYSLWIDYRRFVRQPDSLPTVSAMFYGPINVDTVEGILRSAAFFGIDTQVKVETILESVGRTNISLKPLDIFWSLKSEVYNEHIFNLEGASSDDLLSQALFSIETTST
jgi:HD superfamily phosphohydrolase